MLVERGREVGSDPGRDELLQPILLWRFERSLDRVLLDPDLVDLVLIEERLELAIGYRRVLLACLVEALRQREPQECEDDVPDIDLGLTIFWIAKTIRKFFELPSKCRLLRLAHRNLRHGSGQVFQNNIF